jgi:hypothetical protein
MFAKEIIAARFGGVCHWVVVYSLSHLIYACHLYFSISDLHVIPLPLCCAPHQSTMICTYFRKRRRQYGVELSQTHWRGIPN